MTTWKPVIVIGFLVMTGCQQKRELGNGYILIHEKRIDSIADCYTIVRKYNEESRVVSYLLVSEGKIQSFMPTPPRSGQVDRWDHGKPTETDTLLWVVDCYSNTKVRVYGRDVSVDDLDRLRNLGKGFVAIVRLEVPFEYSVFERVLVKLVPSVGYGLVLQPLEDMNNPVVY